MTATFKLAAGRSSSYTLTRQGNGASLPMVLPNGRNVELWSEEGADESVDTVGTDYISTHQRALAYSLMIAVADNASPEKSRTRTSPRRYGFGFTSIVVGLFALAATTTGVHASSSSSISTPTSNSLPRSIPRSNNSHGRHITEQTPPWNPSAHIDSDGFLSGLYPRIPGEWESEVRSIRGNLSSKKNGEDCQVMIRQVPGDGNCLFHSISLCLHHAVNGTHWDLTANSDNNSKENENGYLHMKDGYLHIKLEDGIAGSSSTSMEQLYQQSQKLRAQAVDCLR
jgi:hypothetical protein